MRYDAFNFIAGLSPLWVPIMLLFLAGMLLGISLTIYVTYNRGSVSITPLGAAITPFVLGILFFLGTAIGGIIVLKLTNYQP